MFCLFVVSSKQNFGEIIELNLLYDKYDFITSYTEREIIVEMIYVITKANAWDLIKKNNHNKTIIKENKKDIYEKTRSDLIYNKLLLWMKILAIKGYDEFKKEWQS